MYVDVFEQHIWTHLKGCDKERILQRNLLLLSSLHCCVPFLFPLDDRSTKLHTLGRKTTLNESVFSFLSSQSMCLRVALWNLIRGRTTSRHHPLSSTIFTLVLGSLKAFSMYPLEIKFTPHVSGSALAQMPIWLMFIYQSLPSNAHI